MRVKAAVIFRCPLLWAKFVLTGLPGLLLFAMAGSADGTPPQLGLPLQCTLGKTCFIQQYVDNDTGPGALDYTCGGATYDGHKGTDFRIRTLADVDQGVPVLAAADGIVKAVRDGVPDRLVQSDRDRQAVAGRECGNGVVISHGDGWETQYCHLKRGSIVANKGARVTRGQTIGSVGYSGRAEFPHVHLSLRRNGEAIDPFTGRNPSKGCRTQPTANLWSDAVAEKLVYRAGEILAFEFADGPVDLQDLVKGSQPLFAPSRHLPAIVVYMWAINLVKGDRIHLVLLGPDGELVRQEAPALERNKAQYMLFTGKKRPAGGWPKGTYTARLEVIRNGEPAHRRINSLVID